MFHLLYSPTSITKRNILNEEGAMTFSGSISKCLRHYADFKGTAGRTEFWFFFLFIGVLDGIGHLVDYQMMGNDFWNVTVLHPARTILILPVFLPFMAAGCRRLRDSGRSPWWQLLIFTGIGIVPLLYLWSREGLEG